MLLVSWILETQETQIAKVWNFTNLWLSRFHNILNNLNQFLIPGIETCPDKSHVCYTVWINTNSNLTKPSFGVIPEVRSRSVGVYLNGQPILCGGSADTSIDDNVCMYV